MSEQPLIYLEGLSKVFYTEEVETHALSNINLEIQTGEFVSIAGPSGCGKTTLLSILGLLDSPTAGTYMLDNTPVEDLTASQRAKIRNQAIGVHLPGVQPDRRPDGVRERGVAADVPRHAGQRA